MESVDNDSNIRFEVQAADTYWMRWSDATLSFNARIVKQSKTDGKWIVLDPDDMVIPSNNAAHSYFQDIKVKLNYQAIDGGNGLRLDGLLQQYTSI